MFAEFETKLRRERQLEGIAKGMAAGIHRDLEKLFRCRRCSTVCPRMR
jgi:DNA invertase Pin-like site-specific DNA recombinase